MFKKLNHKRSFVCITSERQRTLRIILLLRRLVYHILNHIPGQLLRILYVNSQGRSYVTQGDRKIRDLPPFPSATVVEWRPLRDPGFSWPKEIGKSTTLPPSPPATVVEWDPCGIPGFLTLPLPGRHQFLLAGAGRIQPIRMEEACTPTIWNQPRTVICDK